MATPIDRRTHLPVNLADWRLQRCTNSTSGGARAARDGATVAGASDSRLSPAGQSGPLTTTSSARHAGATDLSLSVLNAEPISAAHPNYLPHGDRSMQMLVGAFGFALLVLAVVVWQLWPAQ
jgi:hypothetical protein